MPQFEQESMLSGGLNLDDSFISPAEGQNDSAFLLGDYRYALNVHIGSSQNGNNGGAQNIRGTLKVSTIMTWNGSAFITGGSMPVGTNKCVGRFENKKDQNLIFLNYNSNGNHGIYRFELKENKIYEVLVDSILNFSQTDYITQMGMFGSILFFTHISNPQRFIDINTIHQIKYNIEADGKVLTDFHISLIKYPPAPPQLILSTEAGVTDHLEEGVYQACYRYVYKDNTRSVWSARSNLATKNRQIGGTHNKLVIKAQGYIHGASDAEVTSNGGFNAFKNNDKRAQEFIDHIEIAVRESQYAPYKYITAKDFDSIGTTIAEFFNDVKGVPVATTEINQLQDYIPLRSGACEGIDNRILLGDNIEDFPHVQGVLIDDPQIYQSFGTSVDLNRWWDIGRNKFPAASDYDRLYELNQGNTLSFKNGGIYQLAIEFGDEAGRKSLAYAPDELRFEIPWGTDSGNEYVKSVWASIGFKFNDNFKPPEWATWYQILRSECLNIEYFVKGVANGMELRRDNPSGYVGESVANMSDLSNLPVYDSIKSLLLSETTSDISQASYIYIDIRNWDNPSIKSGSPSRPTERDIVQIIMGNRTKESLIENPSNKIYYNFEEGDRVRFSAYIFDGTVKLKVFDLPIKKIDSYYLVVDKPEEITSITYTYNFDIEVYRPKKVPEDSIPLYECGEWYPILYPKTANRTWSKSDWRLGPLYNFDVTVTKYGDRYIYHKYPIRNGDVHVLSQTLYHDYNSVSDQDSTDSEYIREVMNPDPENTAGNWEHCSGRSNVAYSHEARQREKETQIKFGGKYIEDSIRNNLNNFEEENQKIYPSSYGKLQSLIATSSAQVESVGEIILAIFTNETVSIYVNRTTAEELSGRTQILLSDKVLGSYNTLLGSFGTINPESVTVNHGRVYFFDANNGSWIRYGRDGLTAISSLYKLRNFHKNIADFLIDYYDTAEVPVIISGYDKYNDELIVAFKHSQLPATFEGVSGPYKACCFNDSPGEKRWKSFYNLDAPEMFGNVNNTFVMFLNGELYLHEEGGDTTFNTFFGNKYDSKIEFITNLSPKSNKVFQYIYEVALDKWSVELFQTDEKKNGGQAQESYLSLSSFTENEGTYYSDILNDKHSYGYASEGMAIINGDAMRGKYLRTLLKLDPAVNYKTSLDYIGVGFVSSEKNPKY